MFPVTTLVCDSNPHTNLSTSSNNELSKSIPVTVQRISLPVCVSTPTIQRINNQSEFFMDENMNLSINEGDQSMGFKSNEDDRNIQNIRSNNESVCMDKDAIRHDFSNEFKSKDHNESKFNDYLQLSNRLSDDLKQGKCDISNCYVCLEIYIYIDIYITEGYNLV